MVQEDNNNNNNKDKDDSYLTDEESEQLEYERNELIAKNIIQDGNGGRIKIPLPESEPPKIFSKIDLDPHIPDRDYAEYYINVVKKTVRREDSFVRQVFYTALSKDSEDPLNLAVLATTSEGKTYGITQTLQYFVDKGLWYIGSMTPKVIVRQNGLLVDSNYKPLKPQLKELEKQLKEAEKKKDTGEVEELEEEIEQLKDNAKVLIDLTGRCLVFLEPPHSDTWNILKATLSHDRYEIEHPYVYEVPGLGFHVKKIVTRGWPSCIFASASARNESRWSIWPEIQSRFLVISPNIVPEKVHEGNILISQRMSLPGRIKSKIIVSSEEKEIARKCAKYLVEHVKSKMTQEPDKQKELFWIPYGLILGAAMRSEKGSDNRVTTRMFSFLRMAALLRSHLRCRLQYFDENLIIPSMADLHETCHIIQNISGIPNYKLSMYTDHYLRYYRTKYENQKGEPDTSKDGKKTENVFGITNKEFSEYYREETGRFLDTKSLRETFVEEWYANGLIEQVESVINAKQYIHYPIVILEPISSIEKDFGNDIQWYLSGIRPLGVSALSPIVLQPKPLLVQKNFKEIPENWLEMQVSALLQWEFQEGGTQDLGDLLSSFQIYDENGINICLCQFFDKYNNSISWSLNSYYQNGISYKKPEKNVSRLKYLDEHTVEECKMIDEMLKSPINPMPTRDVISGVNLANHHYSYLVTRKFSDQAFSPEPESEPKAESEPESCPYPYQYPEPGSPSHSLSDTPDTILTDGPYAHLIDIRYLPNSGYRVYSCKEHPDAPEYYDLNGIMVSHFKAFHTNGKE